MIDKNLVFFYYLGFFLLLEREIQMKNTRTSQQWLLVLREELEELEKTQWGSNHLLLEAFKNLLQAAQNILQVRAVMSESMLPQDFASITDHFRLQAEGELASAGVFCKVVLQGGPKLPYSILFEWKHKWFGFLTALHREIEN